MSYLRDNDAEFEVRVQLCSDLDSVPVEDASKEWPEDESSYRTVARLSCPGRKAYSSDCRAFVDGLAFCVSHNLAAHRPFGSIMRARLRAYPVMSPLRRETNGLPVREPTLINEVPASSTFQGTRLPICRLDHPLTPPV